MDTSQVASILSYRLHHIAVLSFSQEQDSTGYMRWDMERRVLQIIFGTSLFQVAIVFVRGVDI